MKFKAEDLVKQAIDRYGDRIAVACSFGKGSMAVLHMAIKYDPMVKVIFENTGVEFKETIHYKNLIKKEWNLNLYETKPLKSFWQCVEEYGIPTTRKTHGKGSNSPKCCQYLKEKPGLIMQKELGVNAILTGIQSAESNSRSLLAMRYDNKKAKYMEKDDIEFCSQRWFTISTGMWSYHPIMHWSDDQVWKYIHDNNIPVNEVYTKWDQLYPRCGCLPCTAYLSWKERLSVSHPRLYDHLIRISGEGQLVLK